LASKVGNYIIYAGKHKLIYQWFPKLCFVKKF